MASGKRGLRSGGRSGEEGACRCADAGRRDFGSPLSRRQVMSREEGGRRWSCLRQPTMDAWVWLCCVRLPPRQRGTRSRSRCRMDCPCPVWCWRIK